MPGVTGAALTVALEPSDGVGDTDGVDIDGVREIRRVASLDVRERYSPDERGERVMGVSGRISDEAALDGDVDIDDDGGEYDIGDVEIGEDETPSTSGSVSNSSVSNGSDSNGSDSIKLSSSEWCDERNDRLELKELGEGGLRRGGDSGMAIGLALPVTVGGLEG